LEKAIEIKRRAQRCIQNGDLDGALSEYQKLTGSEDSDPYTLVLIADLYYKKGDSGEASQSYLAGVSAYEKAGLFKNAIAICKKMMRLSLSAPVVLQRLGQLHALDGLSTEAALYFMQYAEHQTRQEQFKDAAATLRKAYEASPETLHTLERLAEVELLAGDEPSAVEVLLEAATRQRQAGHAQVSARLRDRAEELRPGSAAKFDAGIDAPSSIAPPAAPALPTEAVAEESIPPAAAAASDTEVVPTSRTAAHDLPIQEAGEWFTTNAGEMGISTGGPGLSFEAPGDAGPAAGGASDPPLAEIEQLLREADEQFRAGERERAGETLVQAARRYDMMGRFDSGAAIYRSLGKSAHVTSEVMTLWLANCESRNDTTEASQVACAMGEHALNDGDVARAREWFERSRRFDAGNDLAARRLARLEQGATAPAGEDAPAPSNGKVEVALGRAQAVTLDLGSMIAEFQRGVEAQLSGDAQSHYDLGMTYREMGLLDQAVDSFRVAARDSSYVGRCAEMIGRSLLDQGRFEEAAAEFDAALAHPDLIVDAQVNLRYQLGLAYEAAGRPADALVEFERVYSAQANFPDVALKIRGLRRAPESV
jgi:tetratricopeptide (TPR) repeat protein